MTGRHREEEYLTTPMKSVRDQLVTPDREQRRHQDSSGQSPKQL